MLLGFWLFDRGLFSETRLNFKALNGPKYRSSGLEKILDKYIKGEPHLSTSLTSVIIPAFDTKLQQPVFFSSWRVWTFLQPCLFLWTLDTYSSALSLTNHVLLSRMWSMTTSITSECSEIGVILSPLHSRFENCFAGKAWSSRKCTGEACMPGYSGSSNISATSTFHADRRQHKCSSGVQFDWWRCCCEQSGSSCFHLTSPKDAPCWIPNLESFCNFGWDHLFPSELCSISLLVFWS